MGDSLAVDLDMDQPVELAEVSGIFSDLKQVAVSEGQTYGTPEEVAGTEEMNISRLRQSSGAGISFWLVADGVKNDALTALNVAELMIRDSL